VCGIAGIVNLKPGPAPEVPLIRRMIGRLKHRGPDSSGYYRDERVALGHARLAIIDLEGGAQPLCNEDGSVWLTFNGEIFNYVELAEELKQRGHVLQTRSDTEVIVHAYEEWGTDCFRRMNGQWAVALWDRRGAGKVLLSRDRMGIRPLYYTRTDNQRLVFGSEVKALFADPQVRRAWNPAGLAQVLMLWCPVAPRTVFEGVEEVRPGHVVIIEEGQLRSEPYWSLQFPVAGQESHQEEQANAQALREQLVQACRLRFLRADVPVGAYLSGGIDSSVTSALVTQYTEAPLRTFSLRFADSEFDEGQHQGDMVARLGTIHRDVSVSTRDVGTCFPDVLWHAERPILRTAPAPLFLLSKLVRDSGYKVVVTGEGADEVLAGYDIFREAAVRRFWGRDAKSARRATVVSRLYPWMVRNPAQAPAFARAFFGKDLDLNDPGLSHRPRWNATKQLRLMLQPDLREAVNAMDVAGELLDQLPTTHQGWANLSRDQWLEMNTLLSGYILSAQGDRMLMAHSVEGRFPFLDCDFIEYANTLPARHKLMGLDEKHLLKVACQDLLPRSIRNRPKQPYRAPDAASFFFEVDALEWVDELTRPERLAEAGLFHPKGVERLLAKCRRVGGLKMSNTDNMRIVAILSAMLVDEHFIKGNGQGPSTEEPPGPVTELDQLGSAGAPSP
jgi:asparagine synthase (glutamine-hydrolysing)